MGNNTNNPILEISSETQEINIGTPKISTNRNHAKMKNLDYENSGHTGFASSKDIEEIKDRLNNVSSNAIKDLGHIDMSEYDGNYTNFMNTLTEEGEYKFSDDEFEYYVRVYRLGNHIGQFMWYTEDTFVVQNIRSGYINGDTVEWKDWDILTTLKQANRMFAPKNHTHYEIVYINTDIRTWLNSNTPKETKEYIVKKDFDGDKFVVKQYYNDYRVGNSIYYNYYQEYFEIVEPSKIYKRVGTTTSSGAVTWGKWYVFEGLLEETGLTEEQIKALDEMTFEINENGEFLISYDKQVLDIDFYIENNDLIISQDIDVDFNINEDGELEVSYERNI